MVITDIQHDWINVAENSEDIYGPAINDDMISSALPRRTSFLIGTLQVNCGVKCFVNSD